MSCFPSLPGLVQNHDPMTIFRKPTLKFSEKKRKEMPEGLWTKCPGCSEMIHHLALEENMKVCPKCVYHFSMGARERIATLVDEGSFEEIDAAITKKNEAQGFV